jgi:hypothetical protein
MRQENGSRVMAILKLRKSANSSAWTSDNDKAMQQQYTAVIRKLPDSITPNLCLEISKLEWRPEPGELNELILCMFGIIPTDSTYAFSVLMHYVRDRGVNGVERKEAPGLFTFGCPTEITSDPFMYRIVHLLGGWGRIAEDNRLDTMRREFELAYKSALSTALDDHQKLKIEPAKERARLGGQQRLLLEGGTDGKQLP